MGRMYSVTFDGVAVSAAQDLFELTGAAGMAVILHEIRLAQSSDAGDAAAEMARIKLLRFTGAYTGGSGGSAATPQKFNPGDAAATAAAEVNNTTQATGGTSVILLADAWNVQAGYQWLPTPECRPILAASSALVLSLVAAPADALTMSGTLIFEEIG